MARKNKKPDSTRLATNKRARHDYHIHETFEAGIVLKGTEVKAMREGRIQLKDSYVEIRNNEAWLIGVHIGAYAYGNRENHLPERDRKLLLHRREIEKLYGRSQIKGQTIVPLAVYLKDNRIKVEIALVQGKKLFDKRAADRQKTQEKEMREAIKERRY